MRIAQMRMVQIFVEESIDLYTAVKESRSADSDGGTVVTRGEVFSVVVGFALSVGRKIEASVLGVNELPSVSSIKWEMLEIVAENLSRLPDEIDAARASNSPGGSRLTRAEITEIIGEIVRDSIPGMIQIARR